MSQGHWEVARETTFPLGERSPEPPVPAATLCPARFPPSCRIPAPCQGNTKEHPPARARDGSPSLAALSRGSVGPASTLTSRGTVTFHGGSCLAPDREGWGRRKMMISPTTCPWVSGKFLSDSCYPAIHSAGTQAVQAECSPQTPPTATLLGPQNDPVSGPHRYPHFRKLRPGGEAATGPRPRSEGWQSWDLSPVLGTTAQSPRGASRLRVLLCSSLETP